MAMQFCTVSRVFVRFLAWTAFWLLDYVQSNRRICMENVTLLGLGLLRFWGRNVLGLDRDMLLPPNHTRVNIELH